MAKFPLLIYKNSPGILPTMGDWYNLDQLENDIARDIVQIFKDMSMITTKGRKYNLAGFLRYAREIYVTSNVSDHTGDAGTNPHKNGKGVDLWVNPVWCMPPLAALLNLTTDYNILLGTMKYDKSGRANRHIHIDNDYSWNRNFIGIELPDEQPNGTVKIKSLPLIDKDSVYNPFITQLYQVPKLFTMAGHLSVFTGNPWEQTRDILTHGVPLTEKEKIGPEVPDFMGSIVKYALIGLGLYAGYRIIKGGALDGLFKGKKKAISE
jgi:hypothetical protein